MQIGIIKEGKTPPDSRVPLTPAQCAYITENFEGVSIQVQSSPSRCYTDEEYKKSGVEVVDDVSGCEVLMGVKEVPIDQLVSGKTYLFFSHTIKEQAYNRPLLQAIVKNNIRLIDYEALVDDHGIRVIAFGRFAGIVGAHNGLMTWGKRSGKLNLQQANHYKDLAAMFDSYRGLEVPPLRIALTGGGRVARGAMETLDILGIRKVTPEEYLEGLYHDEPIYVQLDSDILYQTKDRRAFEWDHFFKNPGEFTCDFYPYYHRTDLFINAIYWHPDAPVFFTKEEMKKAGFKITTIADITCDIEGSVPSTLRVSTIAEPVYGYDPQTGKETKPYQEGVIDVMAVDNLPNELPRDASEAFGQQLIDEVLPEFLKEDSERLNKATVTINGQLGLHFQYLKGYLAGR